MTEGEQLTGNPPPQPIHRAVRVRNVRDAKRLMTRILKQLQLDQISLEKGRAMAYVCSTFIRLHEGSELEDRIEKMENGMILDMEKRLAQLEREKSNA